MDYFTDVSRKRPRSWNKKIEKTFAKLILKTTSGYTERGKKDYGFPLLKQEEISERVEALYSKMHQPIQVLDIGTANGDFIYNLAEKFGSKVAVIGITAQDFREIFAQKRSLQEWERKIKNVGVPQKILDVAYLIDMTKFEQVAIEKMLKEEGIEKNLDELINQISMLIFYKSIIEHSEIKLTKLTHAKFAIHNCETLFTENPALQGKFTIALEKFDLIVSSTMFMHLVDPMGALQQAYAALKEDGVLVVDRFTFRGLAKWEDLKENIEAYPGVLLSAIDYHKALIDYLKNEGYNIESTYYEGTGANEAIQCVRLTKTKDKPTLELPLIYTNKPGLYRPCITLEHYFDKTVKESDEVQQFREKIIKLRKVESFLDNFDELHTKLCSKCKESIFGSEKN